MTERLICLFVGYICGLFQTGYIVGKLKGIDIREHGSGNAGTTNILRTMGVKYALIVLLGDAIKCGIAIFIIKALYGSEHAVMLELLYLYTSFGVILGHNFPFYMGFKGGKGIAATAGFIIFGLPPFMTIIGIIVFFTTFFVTHYVSLGSILLYASLIVCAIAFKVTDAIGWTAAGIGYLYHEYIIVIVLMTALMLVRHKDNIKRLIAGNERKTYLRSRPEIDVK